MRAAAVLAFGLWIAATPAVSQDLGPGSPPVSAEVKAAIAQSRQGQPEALQRLADAGRPDAQLYAGIFQVFGVGGFSKDGAKGCGYVQKASATRADAMHTLGECYQYGYGGEKDLEKAVATFETAGRMGMAKSKCAAGNVLLELGRDPQRAVALCREGAEAGDADAQTDLANFYLMGSPVPRDPVQARFWYEKAADAGHRNAAFTLGQMFWNGDGVAKDNAKAARYWRIAYDGGRTEAALLLGDEAFVRAGRGEDVWDRKGLEEAAGWYEKALQVEDASVRKTAAERRELMVELQGAMDRRAR